MAKPKGNVYAVGKKFRVKFPMGRDPVTGKYRTIQETYPAEDAAWARLNKLRVEASEGELVAPSRMTVAQFVKRWIDAKRGSNLAPSTIRNYRYATQTLVNFMGEARMNKLDVSAGLAWRGQLLTQPHRGKTPGRYKIGTVHSYQVIVSMMFEDAVKWGVIPSSPFKHIPLPQMDDAEYIVWTRQQMEKFLAYCERHPDGLFWHVMLMTGLRMGEMVALRWDDLFGNRLTVRGTASNNEDGSQTVGPPKSRHGKRTLTLPKRTVEALNQSRDRQRAYREEVGLWWNEENLMFPTRRGEMFNTGTLRRRFPIICREARVPVIRPHDLRHTNATDLMRAGVSPRVVQERLGHFDVAFTLRRYSHPDEDMDAEAAEILDRRSG